VFAAVPSGVRQHPTPDHLDQQRMAGGVAGERAQPFDCHRRAPVARREARQVRCSERSHRDVGRHSVTGHVGQHLAVEPFVGQLVGEPRAEPGRSGAAEPIGILVTRVDHRCRERDRISVWGAGERDR
jgi:hypothetical protein